MSQPLVISAPQDFKKNPSAIKPLLETGVRNSRGGHVADRVMPSRFNSTGDYIQFVRDDPGGPRVPFARVGAKEPGISPRDHDTSPQKTLLRPHPLRMHPPSSDPPDLKNAAELDGYHIQLSMETRKHGHKREHDSGVNPAFSQSGVKHESVVSGVSSGPSEGRVNILPLKESGRLYSSGTTPAIGEHHHRVQVDSPKYVQCSYPPPINPLAVEWKEQREVWQKYKRTGIIDVELCPEVLDKEGNYTWTHCWGLFNLYTFGASFKNDTEFADRVMDILCKTIIPGKPADLDTITLVFTTERISSHLKRLVVDRSIDAGGKHLHRFCTAALPQEFTVLALEAAMKRLTHHDDLQHTQSTCRYHRHRKSNNCYLRGSTKERDNWAIGNRKAKDQVVEVNTILEGVETNEPLRCGTENGDSSDAPILAPGENEDASDFGEAAPVATLQGSEVDTSESASRPESDLDDQSVLTAKACKITVRSRATIAVVGVSNAPSINTGVIQASSSL